MTLSSNRYIALLIFLGNYVLADLITQAYNSFISNDVSPIEKFLLHPIIVILLIISFSSFSTAELLEKIDISYTDESFYPVGATNYILENLDYKNIKIYNSYNTGSYLMFHNIPVFIDSRLDVYCSEFNNTDVFHDYISISNDTEYYEDIFSKYNFSHILLSNDDLVYKYIKRDSNYKLLYEDENFTLFERNVSN